MKFKLLFLFFILFATNIYKNVFADVTTPTLTSRSPAQKATGVATNTTLQFNYDINIIKGTGNVILTPLNPTGTTITIPSTCACITTSGSTATISKTGAFSANLINNRIYRVTMTAGTFLEDGGTNDPAPAITGNNWLFYTGTAPNMLTIPATLNILATSGTYQTLGNTTIRELFPSDFSVGSQTLVLSAPANFEFEAGQGSIASIGTDITFTSITVTFSTITISYTIANTNTFDNMVISGLRIRSTVATATASSNIIQTSNSANFGSGTGYEVTNGATYASVQSFTNPVLNTFTPSTNTINVSTSPTLVMTFNQNITALAGKNITLTPLNPTGTATTISVISAQVSISGAVATITPSTALVANQVYEVTVDAGAFITGGGVGNSNAVVPGTWQFFTGANNMITTSSLSNLCLGSSTFTTLPDFSVQEIFPSDFPVGTSRTIILNAPTNFEFQTGVGSLSLTGFDLSNASIFVTNTQIIAFYDVNASITFDKLIFTGVRVRAINSVSTGNVVRSGGSGIYGQTDHILPANFTVASLSSVALPSAPTVTGSPFNYCLGDDMSLKNVTATGGTTYKWYSDAGLTTQVATGATVTTASLGVSSLTLNTKDIWVVNDNGTCASSPPTKITFIINDNPLVFLNTSVPTNKICAGQTITFTASGTPGIEYSFKLDRTAPTVTSFPATAFSVTTTNTTSNLLTPGNYTMVVTGRNTITGCQTSSTINTFDIFAKPTVTFVAPTQTSYAVTNNSPINLTTAPGASVLPAGGVFSGNGISGNNFIPSVAGTGSHTITYTFTDANGCSDSKTINLTVGSGGFIISEFFCEGDPLSLVSYAGPGNLGGSCNIDPSTVVTGFYGPTYAYVPMFSYPGGICYFDPNYPLINTNLVGNEFVEIEGQIKPFCNSFAFYFKSFVLKKPTPTITGNLSVCEGQTNVKYSVVVPVGSIATHTYNWTVTGGNIVGSSTNNEVFVNWGIGGVGSVTVTQTAKYPTLGSGGGQCSTTRIANITINSLPTPVISGAVSLCESATNTIVYNIATPQVNHTYSWNVSGAGGAIVSTTATSATVRWTIAGTGTISVQDTDNMTNCINTVSRTVTVNPIPTATITGSINVCINTTNVNYNIPIIASRTYLWSLPSGGGNIASGGTTNSVNINWTTAGTFSVQLLETINATGCQNIYTRNVFVNPLPIADIIGSNVVCANSTGNNYTSSGSTALFSYNWTVTNGTITSGAGTPTITVTWSNTATGNVSLIKTDLSTACVSSVNNFAVTINTLPTPAISGINSLCELTTGVNYNTPNNAGSTYNWVIAGGVITSATNLNAVTVSWGNAGVGTLTVTETNNNGCTRTTSIYNVTKTPLPNPNIVGTTTLCESSTSQTYTTANTAGNVYAWTITGGTITAGAGTNSIMVDWGLAGGNPTLKVQETNTTGCIKETPLTNITLNPLPTPTILGNATVCASSVTNYSVLTASNRSYNWTVTGGSINSGQGTNQINVTWGTGASGTVSVTETITNPTPTCSKNALLNVTINSLPIPSISGTNSLCELTTGVSYNTTNNVGSIYTWAITGGVITSATNLNAITVNWGNAGIGTLTVTETNNNGCVKTTSAYNVTKISLPNPNIVGTTTLCELSTSQTYITANTPGNTYLWTITGGTITAGAGTNSITVDWGGVGGNPTLKVQETNAATCSKETPVTSITLNPLPVPTILGNAMVCASSVNNYSVLTASNRSYNWTVTGGSINSGQGTNQINVTWGTGASGTLSVTETITNPTPTCSKNALLNVTINPLPAPVISGNTTVCENATGVTYQTNNNVGFTYNWVVTGGFISAGQNSNQITVTWGSTGAGTVVVTETSDKNCATTTTTYNVNKIALPNPVVTGSLNICANATGIAYSTPNNAGSSYAWSITGGTIIAGGTTNAITVTWGTAGTGTLFVTETNSTGCTKTSNIINITKNAFPTPIISGSISVCANTTGVIYQTNNTAGSTFSWTVLGGFITAGNNTNQITVTWGTVGIGSVTVSETSNQGCLTTTSAYIVTKNAFPAPSISGNVSVCENATGITYQTNNNVGFTYNWVVTGGFISAGQNSNQITVTWGSTGAGTVIVTETSDKNCATTTTAYNVTKTLLPNPTIAGSLNVCEFSNASVYTASTTGGAYNWTVTGGTIASGQGTNQITVNWGAQGGGSVSVIETTGGGCIQVTPTLINIIKFAIPNPTISGNNDLCENNTNETYSTPNNPGNTYSWSITPGSGFITSSNNSSQITVNWGLAGTGSLTVTETNAIGCSRTSNIFNVTKNPYPNPIIGGSNTVCENSGGHTYNIMSQPGHTYNWTVTGGFVTAGNNTNQITVTWDVAGLGTLAVTQTSNKGCITTTPIFNVTKRALPTPTITGNSAVCEFSTTTYSVTSNANRVYNWVVTGGNITSGQGTNSITVNWLNANTNPASPPSVKLTETVNYAASAPFTAISCQAPTATFNITINPLPVPNIFGSSEVCAGINLQSDVITTTYKYSYSAQLLANMNYVWSIPTNNGIITNGTSPNLITVEWNNNTTVGQIKLVQTSTLSPFCQGTTTSNITINPTPYTDYTVANICFGDNTTFTPAVINNGWKYEWRFSDGTTISNTQIAVKQFGQVGNQTVKLITTNIATGCTTEFEKVIKIYAVPQPTFTYLGSCQAGGNSQTQFTDNSTITTGYTITQWQWDFGDGTPIFTTTNPATKNPLHSYALPGEYLVKLTVRGDVVASCSKSLTQKITIFPKYTVTQAVPYYENFDAGKGNWIASDDIGNVKNWKHGTSIVGRNIQPKYPTDKYWVVGIDSTYRNNVKSYIETPCFDITQLTKPILAMKIWSDADKGADGTALFVTYNDGGTWTAVGDTSQGLNWFDARNILAIPGSGMTTSNDVKRVGWTGKTNGWKNASFALDEVRQTSITSGNGTVRFRFAFASNGDNPVNNWDGFAVDSVFVGERNRRVLIENFTSTQNIAVSEYSAMENIANVITNETILLQYFPTFAETNRLSQDNTADPGARSLLYGISSVPRGSVDGKSKTQVAPSTWVNNEFLRRSLVPAPFNITITFPSLPADKLNIKANITTNIANNKPLIIHTVIVEETVATNNSNAPVVLRNVVKRMLPSAAGTFIPRRQRNVGDAETFEIAWSLYDVAQSNGANPRIYDWSKVAVVIFIQDDESNEVYQAVFAKPNVLPNIISAVESATQTHNQAIIAPNPAIDEVFVGFEEKTLNDYNIDIVDNFGKLVYQNAWTAEEKGIRFSVKNFAKGIYFVRIYDTRKNLIVTKKMIVQ